MSYEEWCGRRNMAVAAVIECCASVAKVLGIEYRVEPTRRNTVVGNPGPGGFRFKIRWGHLEAESVTDGLDVFDVDSFNLPPHRNTWPEWLGYLGFMMRFHWFSRTIGDEALFRAAELAPEKVATADDR